MSERAGYGAGIVHYGSDPGLAGCLASLRAQTHPPAFVVVVDHDPPQDRSNASPGASADAPASGRSALQAEFPEVEWVHAVNGGYSAGANRVVERVLAGGLPLEYVLILNPDVELEPDFAEQILAEVEARPEVALASGKLLRPGAALIDSAGIERSRGCRFSDRGSEEPDDGRYDAVEPVFAVSGAALFLRRAALPSLTLEGELFDEDFFTYHEDTDLAWRAGLLGWQCLYVPSARAIHVRGWRRGARRRVPDAIRRHSFKNRYLELIKNESPLALLRDLPFVLAVEVARMGFALMADRALLSGYLAALRLAGRAFRKRAILHDRRRWRGPVTSTGAVTARVLPALPGAGARPIASARAGLTEGN
ncbi:glycosyltransferase family 2 protein [Myxococcota bacterium]|nr:glycosyltransferase family 2 protein [Myxococcota bacterium]